MVDGLSRTKHWALGAIVAALCSFVYAKVPAMPHSGGAPHGGFHRGGGDSSGARGARGVGRIDARSDPHSYAPQRPRGGQPERNARLSRDMAPATNYPDGYGYNAARRPSGSGGYPVDRGGLQYAGAITPVSTDSRSVPRPPGNPPVRAGSIRADVARYNEERGASRAIPRSAEEGRPQEGTPYRN